MVYVFVDIVLADEAKKGVNAELKFWEKLWSQKGLNE